MVTAGFFPKRNNCRTYGKQTSGKSPTSRLEVVRELLVKYIDILTPTCSSSLALQNIFTRVIFLTSSYKTVFYHLKFCRFRAPIFLFFFTSLCDSTVYLPNIVTHHQPSLMIFSAQAAHLDHKFNIIYSRAFGHPLSVNK